MAVAMSPALSKPALAATETLENLEADLMICKVRRVLNVRNTYQVPGTFAWYSVTC